MQFSAGQDVRLKNYRAQSSFYRRPFKHGLLDGSTFLFQYSSMTCAPLESCRLVELKYTISPGQHLRLKNNSIRKCKNDIVRRASMVTVLCVGPDKSGQVRTGVKYYFSLTVSPTPLKFGPAPKPAFSFLTVPRLKLYDPPKWWNRGFVTLELA